MSVIRKGVFFDGLRLAVGTLTAFPVGAPTAVDASTARVAMLIAPVAVLPVAVTAAAVGEVGRLVLLGPFILAALVVGTFALGSRCLHLDGLADTADGLTASYDRERALEIMRRGNTGPAGAATLILVLLLQTYALAVVLARPWGLLVGVGLLVLARSSLLVTCAAGLPAARPGGLGAIVVGVVPRSVSLAGLLLTATVASAIGVLSGRPWWQGFLAAAVAAVAVVALSLRCRKRFGGITGDVLGAGIEVAATALLLGVAAGS